MRDVIVSVQIWHIYVNRKVGATQQKIKEGALQQCRSSVAKQLHQFSLPRYIRINAMLKLQKKCENVGEGWGRGNGVERSMDSKSGLLQLEQASPSDSVQEAVCMVKGAWCKSQDWC